VVLYTHQLLEAAGNDIFISNVTKASMMACSWLLEIFQTKEEA
jgi:hypothetical protein